MAEFAFEGGYQAPNNQDVWGLDGWTSLDRFILIASNDYNGTRVDLDEEHCSILIAALAEHLKELKDAEQENSS